MKDGWIYFVECKFLCIEFCDENFEMMIGILCKVFVNNNSGNNEWYMFEYIIEFVCNVLGEIELDFVIFEIVNWIV